MTKRLLRETIGRFLEGNKGVTREDEYEALGKNSCWNDSCSTAADVDHPSHGIVFGKLLLAADATLP